MDGLDRLIEMFERRFGKFWGDALLLVFVLGAAAWAIHSVVVNVVSPVVPYVIASFNYVSGMHIVIRNRPFTFEDLVTALVAVPVFIGMGYGSYRMGYSFGFYRRRAISLLSTAQAQAVKIANLEMENAALRANTHPDAAQSSPHSHPET